MSKLTRSSHARQVTSENDDDFFNYNPALLRKKATERKSRKERKESINGSKLILSVEETGPLEEKDKDSKIMQV